MHIDKSVWSSEALNLQLDGESSGTGCNQKNTAVSKVMPHNTTDDFARARLIVEGLAQLRIEYSEWIKTGMSLYAGFGEAGRDLWNLFLHNPHYSETQANLDKHWRSFRSVRHTTLASLFYIGGKYNVKCQ